MISPRTPECPDCRRSPCECGLAQMPPMAVALAGQLRRCGMMMLCAVAVLLMMALLLLVNERRARSCHPAPVKQHYDRLIGFPAGEA